MANVCLHFSFQSCWACLHSILGYSRHVICDNIACVRSFKTAVFPHLLMSHVVIFCWAPPKGATSFQLHCSLLNIPGFQQARPKLDSMCDFALTG